MTTTIDILIKPVKTKYSTSKISTVGGQSLGMDIEEGRRPYSPKEDLWTIKLGGFSEEV